MSSISAVDLGAGGRWGLEMALPGRKGGGPHRPGSAAIIGLLGESTVSRWAVRAPPMAV